MGSSCLSANSKPKLTVEQELQIKENDQKLLQQLKKEEEELAQEEQKLQELEVQSRNLK